jgi:hypothetical protein
MIDATEFKIFLVVIATVIISGLYISFLGINSPQEETIKDMSCVTICDKGSEKQ